MTWFFARGPRQTTSLDASYDPKNPDRAPGAELDRHLRRGPRLRAQHPRQLGRRGRHRPPRRARRWRVGDRIIFDGAPPARRQLATATPQAGLNGSTISLMPGGRHPAQQRAARLGRDRRLRQGRSARPAGPTNLAGDDVAEGKKLFEANGCAGCHGSSQWTIAKVFYTPNEDNNAVPACCAPPSTRARRCSRRR